MAGEGGFSAGGKFYLHRVKSGGVLFERRSFNYSGLDKGADCWRGKVDFRGEAAALDREAGKAGFHPKSARVAGKFAAVLL